MPVIGLSQQCIVDLRRDIENLTETQQNTSEQSEKDKLKLVMDNK